MTSSRGKFLMHLVKMRSTKEKRIKAKVMEQGCVSLCVAEWIYVPTYSWSNIEFVNDPLMTYLKVANKIFIICVILISSGPTTHCDL